MTNSHANRVDATSELSGASQYEANCANRRTIDSRKSRTAGPHCAGVAARACADCQRQRPADDHFAPHTWASRVTLVMRQVHIAGQRLFVDYSGHTMEVVDATTSEVQTAQIFVAVMGASNYTYVETTFTRKYRIGLLRTSAPSATLAARQNK
jgi:hypothetical protein